MWITTTAGAGASQELVNKINWPAKSAAVGAYLSIRESHSLAHASYAYACISHTHAAVSAYLSIRETHALEEAEYVRYAAPPRHTALVPI